MLKQSKMMLADGFPALPDFDEMETGEATKQDVYDTQGMIAYVQKTLKADKAYTAGDFFIYNGDLYTATANIAKDATIVITGESANAALADGIQEQIDDLNETKGKGEYTLVGSNVFAKSDFVLQQDNVYRADKDTVKDTPAMVAALNAADHVLMNVYYKGVDNVLNNIASHIFKDGTEMIMSSWHTASGARIAITSHGGSAYGSYAEIPKANFEGITDTDSIVVVDYYKSE